MKDLQNTKTDVTNTFPTYSQSELNRTRVLKFIQDNEPVSQYLVHKKLGLAYNTTRYIIRDLIFAGIVHCQKSVNKNKADVNILTIPKEVEE